MTDLERLGILTYLVNNAPSGWVGRTAMVKFCYLLQAVEEVPLGYHFTLYSYGPFDSRVLADIGNAESLGLVRSTYEQYPSGYGYRIESLISPEKLDSLAGGAVSSAKEELDRILSLFGGRSAAQLELDSTIVFVRNHLDVTGERISTSEIARSVHEVKPHFSEFEIQSRTQQLEQQDVISAVSS